MEEIGINTDTDLMTAEKTIHFDYDPMGKHIAKHVSFENGNITSTFYTLDTQGNCMSICAYNHIETPLEFLRKTGQIS